MSAQWAKTVKVRRRHHCFGCGCNIEPGEEAERWSSVDRWHNDGWVSGYTCKECLDFMAAHDLEEYADDEGCYQEGDIGTARQEEERYAALKAKEE